jgi:hypothetical protein
MTSKRRKELTLPTNFVSFHFNEMDKFLSQRLVFNPLHQRDTMADNDHVFLQTNQMNDAHFQGHTRTQCYIYKAIPIPAKKMIEKNL